jgi:D-3-phosphoglycerate dehydrogenase
MKVLVTDKINEVAVNILTDGTGIEADLLPTMTEDELVEKIKDYDAIMVRSQTKVTDKIINNSHLKIIGRAGVGVDNIDVAAATEKGIVVVNSPDGNTVAAAEHTLAMMMALSRHIPAACESARQGKWEKTKFKGNELFGKTLGIIGFGKIGHHVAHVALALGMKVVVSDPFAAREVVEKAGCEYIGTLDELWGVCDYITVHTPKTKDTIHMINKDTIGKMKKGVKLINCARGGIIDEEALKAAIENGQVGGAAIDVFENEPEIQNSPLVSVDGNIVLTPHLGASTSEAQIKVAVDVAHQIKDVLTGGKPTSPVNKV